MTRNKLWIFILSEDIEFTIDFNDGDPELYLHIPFENLPEFTALIDSFIRRTKRKPFSVDLKTHYVIVPMSRICRYYRTTVTRILEKA